MGSSDLGGGFAADGLGAEDMVGVGVGGKGGGREGKAEEVSSRSVVCLTRSRGGKEGKECASLGCQMLICHLLIC